MDRAIFESTGKFFQRHVNQRRKIRNENPFPGMKSRLGCLDCKSIPGTYFLAFIAPEDSISHQGRKDRGMGPRSCVRYEMQNRASST